MHLLGNFEILHDDKFSSLSETSSQTTSGKFFENLLMDRSNISRLSRFDSLQNNDNTQ